MKKNSYFEDLMESLTSVIEHESGKIDLRTTEVEILDLPPRLSGRKIKSLRENVLGVSQPVFAKLIGVSPAAVKAWEQGSKKPSGSARRLMEIVEKEPVVLKRLVHLRKASGE